MKLRRFPLSEGGRVLDTLCYVGEPLGSPRLGEPFRFRCSGDREPGVLETAPVTELHPPLTGVIAFCTRDSIYTLRY
ncbi:MAG: hypothetical protein MJE66_10065 [Proteobacteria bacterium]|nr:hypothetical protein [Pseudomonadota bacterium]